MRKLEKNRGAAFLQRLGVPFFADELFDSVTDTVYFVKDEQGRYIAANRTLADRCGLKDKQSLIGLTAADVFPASLGRQYVEQDEAVLHKGRSVQQALELHLYPDGTEGWCLTWKEPLRNDLGRIVGIVGLSRDVTPPRTVPDDFAKLTEVLNYVREKLDTPLRNTALAKVAGLSPYQLNRRMKAAFGRSARDIVSQERIARACLLLKSSSASISQIALECGYSDQAAFTRHFKRTVGMTPSSYSNTARRAQFG